MSGRITGSTAGSAPGTVFTPETNLVFLCPQRNFPPTFYWNQLTSVGDILLTNRQTQKSPQPPWWRRCRGGQNKDSYRFSFGKFIVDVKQVKQSFLWPAITFWSLTSPWAGLRRLRHPLHAFLPSPRLKNAIDFQHHLREVKGKKCPSLTP